MQKNGISKIEAADGTFSASVQNNPPSVDIIDLAAIPTEFMRIKIAPPPEPDKTAIKKALSEGKLIDGASLKQTQRLVIK